MVFPAGNIQRTLLNGLFVKPKVISRSEYLRAKRTLFPGEDLYLDFLKSADRQELVDKAKEIVLRMIHHCHLPPASRLLFNLLSFEESEQNRSKGGDYLPQDHFVHLVHLYLTGVYLFATHPAIHRFARAELNRIKRSLSKRRLRKAVYRAANPYEFFGLIWAQFVLFHDLGYPLERVPSSARLEAEEFFKPFLKIRKSISKDVALRALSRLVALYSIIFNGDRRALGSMYLGDLDSYYIETPKGYVNVASDSLTLSGLEQAESDSLELDLEDWMGARYLSQVEGLKSLHLLLAVVKERDVAAVLEDAVSGQPILLVRRSPGEHDIVWLEEPGDVSSAIRNKRKDMAQLAFDQAKPPTRNCSWRYFAREPEAALDAVVDVMLPGRMNDFLVIVDRLKANEAFRRSAMTKDDAADQVAYVVFREMSNILGYLEQEEESSLLSSERAFRSLTRGFEAASPKVPGLVGACVQDLLSDAVKKREIKPGRVLKEKTRVEAAKYFVKHVADRKTTLSERVAARIDPEIQAVVELEQAVDKCFRVVRKTLEPLAKDPVNFHFRQVGEELAVEVLFNRRDARFEDLAVGLEDQLERLDLGDLGSLIEEYRPSWVQSDPDLAAVFIDHGFASTALLMDSVAVYDGMIERLETEPSDSLSAEAHILRLNFATTSKHEEGLVRLAREALIQETISMVLLHNIYPSSFTNEEKKKYRTKLLTQPLAFLGLLVDGLQRWDRKRFVDTASADGRGFIPGARFNLTVEDKMIVISLVAARIDMAAEESALRQSLGEFLDGADGLIKLRLLER